MVADVFDSTWSAMSRKLLQAEVSLTCSAGLLKMARGLRNLEPWAFRLFDASGKYPSGLLQATTSDPGAFDECVETVVYDPASGRETTRAQYCNLRLRLSKDADLLKELVASFQIGHPRMAKFEDYFTHEKLSGVRVGVCVVNDCNETELQALIDTAGLANNIKYFERWENMILTAGYLSVDTFFFLRATIPLFFVIMCMYLLPAITSGPDAKTFFDKFYYEVNNHWWDLLLQVRNFRKEITFSVMPHIWYLSADFQLFTVSLAVYLLLKSHRRCLLAVFVLLSLVGCSVATWQVAGTHLNPFMVAMTETVP
ncbi:hypothetical protein V5799_029092 [Amblyomma americanum]|uniref:Nose resistant-to-fluoxetine protein N-terminal domain-containing protein n=1 Tax=Amblyomma americanum TaxID=6943 RepID=A0AAQ4EST6_AMBAM